MKRIYKIALIVISFILLSNTIEAQQDAQYTQYMYNTLSINPAYAGSRDVFSFVGLYRAQWVGLEGAPRTFTASAHTPAGEHIGLGLNITRDEIFISQETYIDFAFSYNLNISRNGTLALGLKAGGHLLDVDSERLNRGAFNPGDANAEINIDNKFSPQFGLGAYYYTDKFYLGISAPNILETKHFDESSSNSSSATAKERINFYAITGYVFNLNESIELKPAALIKAVSGAPLQVDLSANFLIEKKITLGVAYRWSAALSAMAGFQISDQVMLGFAYDREVTELQQYNNGSYEFFLRYELFNKRDRLINPRFF